MLASAARGAFPQRGLVLPGAWDKDNNLLVCFFFLNLPQSDFSYCCLEFPPETPDLHTVGPDCPAPMSTPDQILFLLGKCFSLISKL